MAINIRSVAAALAVSVFAFGPCAAAVPASAQPTIETTRGFQDEINRPPEPYRGPQRNGSQVYSYRCMSCHARTTQGAPMPGDDIEWGMRAKQGMRVLMEHVINGYNRKLMPPRGGCSNCNDAELRAAVVYMLEKSGIKVESLLP